MPNEHIEQRINFIIEHLAKFAVNIEKLQEGQVRLEAAQERTDDMLRRLIDVNLSLANHVESLANHVQAADEKLSRLSEETARRFRELAESQIHTDRRLDALINIVDKLARHNGGQA